MHLAFCNCNHHLCYLNHKVLSFINQNNLLDDNHSFARISPCGLGESSKCPFQVFSSMTPIWCHEINKIGIVYSHKYYKLVLFHNSWRCLLKFTSTILIIPLRKSWIYFVTPLGIQWNVTLLFKNKTKIHQVYWMIHLRRRKATDQIAVKKIRGDFLQAF